MKTKSRLIWQRLFCRLTISLNTSLKSASAMIAAAFLYCADSAMTQTLPGSPPPPLASWSFHDTNAWTSDQGYSPISFTNISWSDLGDWWSLDVNTNVPVWLNYYIYEPTNGATNLTVDIGSITFWYGPGWDTTNGGPGNWAQLIDVGEWTSNSSYGYWGISIDPSGSNVVFGAQDGLGNAYGLYAPMLWTTNYFHFIALTYSSTNVSLYLDGVLATNDPGGLSIWPGSNVLSNGVFFGSNTNGEEQAQGLFDTIQTYSSNLDSGTIQFIYTSQNFYALIPVNSAFMALSSATSSPSYTPQYEAISGPGNLLWVTNVSSCVDGTSAYNVWITNVTARAVGSGTNAMTTMTFTIEGGESGVPYDVFANSVLYFGTNGYAWAWMGQGYQCNTYTLTNLQSQDGFLILGTPYTSNPGLGLTDAYELLVLQISPSGPQYDSYGVPYAWYAQHGLTTLTNGLATADPDQDALLNYQEYLYGTDPQVSQGFEIWVGTPNGTSGVP
jgi:hypothetical protein